MRGRAIHSLLLLTLPTVVVALGVLVLMHWHIPTRVRVDVTVDRAVFTIDGGDWEQILDSVGFESITVERFDQIELQPENLEVADQSKFVLSENRYLESAWTPVEVTPPMIITAEDETLQPAVTFEGRTSEQRQPLGTLDRIWATPGSTVILETRGVEKAVLTIKVEHQGSSAAMSIHQPFRLFIDYGRVAGVSGLPHRTDALALRAELPNHNRAVKVSGQPRSLVVVLTVARERAGKMLSAAGIPITSMEFTRQDSRGYPESSVLKTGEMAYQDLRDEKPVIIKDSNYLGLNRLEKFRIQSITLDAESGGIRFLMSGVAGYVMAGPREFPADRRLTRFDLIWKNPKLMILFSIIVWVFPTTVGGYRLYKEYMR